MNFNNFNVGIGFKQFTLILIILVLSIDANAHVVDLDYLTRNEVSRIYLELGFKHILPLGFDHILFILSLYLLSPKLKDVIVQATAFTVAHTVTLGLSMYKIITPPSAIIEPIIALSIMYVALENIFSPKLRTSRIGIVFLFGLVHGMGFASVLSELGLPKSNFFFSLIMFNVGVELGQITVIILAFSAFGLWFREKPYYRKAIVIPLSIIITIIAGYWTVERFLGT